MQECCNRLKGQLVQNQKSVTMSRLYIFVKTWKKAFQFGAQVVGSLGGRCNPCQVSVQH